MKWGVKCFQRLYTLTLSNRGFRGGVTFFCNLRLDPTMSLPVTFRSRIPDPDVSGKQIKEPGYSFAREKTVEVFIAPRRLAGHDVVPSQGASQFT
jgi:hypothetical protein